MRYKRAAGDLDALGREANAIVREPPGRDLPRLALLHADNDVAVPGPSVRAVEFAGQRRMIRMGMVPAHQVETAFASNCFRAAEIIRKNRESIARRITVTVLERKQVENLAAGITFATEQGTATLVRVAFRGMSTDTLDEYFVQPEHGVSFHPKSVR